ncbi:MAG: alpha-L-fucosidase [Candidatus Methylacidiphilales bacterium]|nr:alpha-L-fucosidase [Candidatus Methylacidiphilales bacterium]
MNDALLPDDSSSPRPPAWWREARFGLFIHWGVYSVPAGVHRGRPVAGASEWLMHSVPIPVDEYKTHAAGFTASAYDADAWVKAAVEAGMGYVVIGAKHHDGFALFETKVNDWNAVDATPAARDVLRPLVEACRRAGLPIGFYYSQAQDWINGGSNYAGNWDPAQDRDFDEYLDQVAIPQIRELLTQYGPGVPSVLWWDTPAKMTPERSARVNAAVQELAPGILQNDRLGEGFPGDFETPEQRIPANRPHRPWETCMTTNESWGFNLHDQDWKPPGLLIRQLCEVVSQGGNYLLNIGPRADGTIPEPTLDALRAIGRWMRVNGGAIRGASAGPFPHRLPWGFATQKGNTIHLLVEQWPEEGKLFVPLLDLPERAHPLADASGHLAATPCPGGFQLTLPPRPTDPEVSVLVLEFAAEPRLGEVPPRPRPPVVPQPADGAITLRAADAELVGDHIALLAGQEPQLGCWTSLESHPLWRVRLHRAGNYRVELVYAVPAHRQGTLAEIDLGGNRLPVVVGGTGGWGEFVRFPAGTVTLAAQEELPVRVLPIRIPVGAVMNLRAVCLTPA